MGFFRLNEPEDTPRDRSFEDFRLPLSDKAKAVASEVTIRLQAYEQQHGLRKRKRKADDQKTFETTVSAVVCDLCHRWLTEPEGWIAVSLSKDNLCRADRYKSPAKNKTLPTVLERLTSPELGIVEMDKGFQGRFINGRQTTIRAGKQLIKDIEDQQLHFRDFSVRKTKEVIILKSGKIDLFTHGKRINYKDDERTIRYRQEMRRINEWLTGADINLDPAVAAKYNVDGSERSMRRIFNHNSFESGGRLYGAFWINMSPQDRFRGIRIRGAPVVMLDFDQMAPRLLYIRAKQPLPDRDLYSLPLFEHRRAGIKQIFNAMCNMSERPKRYPHGTKKYFHRSDKIGRIVDLIEKHHEPVKHLFFTNVGLSTMFTESQITVGAMLKLIDKDIVGLPVHDGILVAEGDKETAIITMLNAFREHTGHEGKVSIEDK